MAKHKGPEDVAVKSNTTKKLKQVAKGNVGGGKKSQKKIAENGVKEIPKKSKPRSQTSKKANGSPAKKHTSKYFQDQLMKEEREAMSVDAEDDDFTTPTVSVASGAKKTETKKEDEDDECEDDSDEDGDWEEVEELTGPLGPAAPAEPTIPSQPVEIEIETPEVARKRQQKEKRKTEFESYLRRMMKRFNKDLVEDTHKVHVLCLLANGIFRNHVCREPDLIAITLSLMPSHFTALIRRVDTIFLNDLLKWFGDTFTLNPELPEETGQGLMAVLERRLGSLTVRNHEEMTHLFLLVLRSLQLFCRLVLSLQPLPIKPPPAKDKPKTSKSPADKSQSPGKKRPTEKSAAEKTSPEAKVSPGSKRPATGRGEGKTERGGKRPKKKHGTGEMEGTGQRPKNTTRRSVASKVSYKDESSEEEADRSSEEEFQLSSGGESEEEEEEGGKKKGRAGKGKGVAKGKSRAPRRSSGAKKTKKEIKSEEEDEEGEEETGKKRREGKGNDEWLEVYLEEAGRWVCVDVEQGVGQVQKCAAHATRPLVYVVGVDGEGYIKDLSRRYDPTWLTSSRKRRIDQDWWDETLDIYEAPDSEREKKEDNELEAKLLSKALPTSILEYKSHPLYALQRHQLKYEALYPPTAAILGYCRGEPVYSRDCIHTLHSKDTWLKEARTVRLGEVPYKMVRGFSNQSRKARMMSEHKVEKDLPLFGEWQTEEYQPPVAVDGKVPRNDFGNVYMFKPCMMPIGCVSLRLPNLHRVARKLDIDCALAVTGFDFHGGYSHAVTDGYIVCEEHEEILRAAWENEQEIQQKKEIEKREKRVVSNWTLLVKGLLIRERLKRRYGQQGLTQQPAGIGQGEQGGVDGLSSGEEAEEVGGGPSTDAPSLASSWPQNRQEEEETPKQSGSKREKRGQKKHLFPFEKV
ncbi:DNA repair protein complementing XP-C cells [Clupea harengus]|uniref:DNA repair protein complementing XP-C cells n=1 Tax=Clupea harengus TaxID=7950 RepID=A0A6P3VWJ1_CLUHA|nr:DNA repair protein complementing XP-C cells [Clupea harengus]